MSSEPPTVDGGARGGDEPATTARERVPDEAHAALRVVETVLGRAPVAAYLSGSAVDGGLRPLSDVDVLMVVDDVPDDEARRRLAAALMRASGRYGVGGPTRPLELLDPVPMADLRRALREALPALLAERLRREVERACAALGDEGPARGR